MEDYKFNYKSLADINKKLQEYGKSLPLSEKTDILGTSCNCGTFHLENRLGVAPMEGMDSLPNGAPSDLTRQRYIEFAKGGAGLIWYEAVSIVPEGRSTLKQLLLTEETLPVYQRMNDEIKEAGMKANGFAPVLVMQANHSGRYSRPNADVTPEPIIAFHHPYHEKDKPVDSSRIATDDYLKSLEEKFGEAASLAKRAGFDAIDIKSCHGYLLAELAGAYTRPGEYGGSFENRFRLLLNAIRSAQVVQDKNFSVVSRLNIYDNYPYPYGFGMAKDGSLTPDYEEPIRLIHIMHDELKMPYINVTMGNPHAQPFITRPCLRDKKFAPPEDPILGVVRMFEGAAAVKKEFPDLILSASAPSYLRQFSPNLAAGAIEAGYCDHVCFGRMAFANPYFANDIIHGEGLTPRNVCVTCSKCSELLRGGKFNGCVVHNSEIYLPYYKELTNK